MMENVSSTAVVCRTQSTKALLDVDRRAQRPVEIEAASIAGCAGGQALLDK